jgi:hypothetical protein
VDESAEPQTPEEEVALRALAAKHWHRRRWIALCWSVSVSVHTTVILHTLWRGWPRITRGLITIVEDMLTEDTED